MQRYNRQLILNEIGEEGQEKLKKSKVLIIGAGGLGSPISIYLTAAGIGQIGIIDDDVVSISNLQRQILYSESDVDLIKVECAKNKLEKLNSEVKLDIYNKKLDENNAKTIISKYDIIVDGTDNTSSRFLINDTCLLLNKVYVYGAINEFHGQVSVFNYKGGANYRDLFSEGDVFPSSKGVLGVLPGIIGCIEATEVIKIITGAGDVLSNKLFTIDLLTMQSHIFNI